MPTVTKLTRPIVSRKTIRILIAGSAALALMAGGAAAGAAMLAGPIDSTGIIHGCYYPATATGSHRVVLQNAGTNCPTGTTAISWSSGAGYESLDTAPIISLSDKLAPVAAVHLPAGNFFMNADVQVQNPATPETAICVLRDGHNHTVASYAGSLTLNNLLAFGEISLTGFNTSGGTTTLYCEDSPGGSTVFVTGAVVTAIPVTTVHRG